MYEVPFRALIASTANLPLDKVAFGFAPDNAPYPLVVLNTVVEVGQYTFQGRNKSREVIIQVDVWGETFATVAGIKNALLGLDGYKREGQTIKNIIMDKVRQGSDNAGPKKLIRYSIDFRVFYS